MQTLKYQGMPVIRPSKELVQLIPHCMECHAPLIWVHNEKKQPEPRCVNPHCSTEIYRIRKELEALEQWEKRQTLIIWRCFFMGLSPLFLAGWLLGFAFDTGLHLIDFALRTVEMFNRLWNLKD